MSDDNFALSFSAVASSYERGRPLYPAEAARWLTGGGAKTVLELGAGTGKLTRALVKDGHRVFATDPSPEMLAILREEVEGVATINVGSAEKLALPGRSIDVVVCAQSFHWFDHAVALPEIARVLRPGGYLALVWNQRDTGIPWVRKLSAVLGHEGQDEDLIAPLRASLDFGWIEEAEFRHWQRLNHEDLRDLVLSRSSVATLDDADREAAVARALELYADYGRGHDGMQLPYITRCYRAQVKHKDPDPDLETDVESTEPPEIPEEPDDGALLIDFR